MREDGLVLSVFKPAGWTSFDVVNKIRGTLKWKSVGHAGTLDPAATGVLIVLCGAATNRSAEFTALAKEYVATIRLGVTTDTDDLDGRILTQAAVPNLDRDGIERHLMKYRGEIEQIPPAFSAIKIGGKRSYQRARAGQPVALPARRVTVHRMDLIAFSSDGIDLRIRCSAGTYIRSIARDLGRDLGCGACLSALERTSIGPYQSEYCLRIDEIIIRARELSTH